MSHYAKVVEPVSGEIHAQLREKFTLAIGTEIKSVKLMDSAYACLAFVRRPYERAARWVSFLTYEDLPAFTDKGRESRAKHPRVTMGRGRPAKGAAPLTNTRGIRMRQDQWDALDYAATNASSSRNEMIVGALISLGLVPR
jgi:hypothetical protein